MSRDLPARPNLDHLKKQAKDLLRDLQQRDPDTKLADAQHALAREYGFDSWPKLHAHVEHVRGLDEPHPLTGVWTWTADPGRDPSAHRSVTLKFDVDGDEVTIEDRIVDASGQELTTENRLRVDGIERAQPHGYAVTARWLGPRGLEAVGSKDGRVEGRVTYDVSPDRKTLMLSANERVLVLERR